MSTRMQQTARRNRRENADPKKIRKHSDIVDTAETLVVLGERTPTQTGYKISGYSGAFETYYETMLPHTATNLVCHPKKTRVIRVLSGVGLLVLRDELEEISRTIHAGDEVVLKPGVTYQISSTNQPLDFHVSQEKTYEARLEVVEGSTATVDITADMLLPGVRITKETVQRRGSKAKQQMQEQQAHRIPSGQVMNLNAGPADMGAAAAPIMNARPSGGRFDEDGAG